MTTTPLDLEELKRLANRRMTRSVVDEDTAVVLNAVPALIHRLEQAEIALAAELNHSDETVSALEAERAKTKGLREALEELYDFASDHGDFRNGVTDSTGTIDEGNVRAANRFREVRAIILGARDG